MELIQLTAVNLTLFIWHGAVTISVFQEFGADDSQQQCVGLTCTCPGAGGCSGSQAGRSALRAACCSSSSPAAELSRKETFVFLSLELQRDR